MFERKNQTLLSEHYNKLVEHEDDSDDDVFTLARVNHDLSGNEASSASEAEEDGPLISSEDLSKRKLKAASTKKGMLKSRPAPTKVVFDDDGAARDFWKAGAKAEEEAGGEEARREFFEKEKERMKEADVIDRQVAREKRRELKRKRKEREREVSDFLCLLLSRVRSAWRCAWAGGLCLISLPHRHQFTTNASCLGAGRQGLSSHSLRYAWVCQQHCCAGPRSQGLECHCTEDLRRR